MSLTIQIHPTELRFRGFFIYPKKFRFFEAQIHIIKSMREQCIEFTSDKRIEEYLEDIFFKSNITFNHTVSGNVSEYLFFADDELKNSIICGILINFFKLRELLKAIPSNGSRSLYALLGALIGLEQEDETAEIMTKLSSRKVDNVDGFYNFCLNNLRESWQNLAKLSSRLYSQCCSEDDVYALSVFMLGMDESMSATVIVNGEELRWEKNGMKIAVVPFFGEREPDIITTLLSQRPSDVVVINPDATSDGLLSVIRALGE